MGVFGILGGVNAAYMTGKLTPYWCFGFYGFFCLISLGASFSINKELEYESDVELELARQRLGDQNVDMSELVYSKSFCDEFSHNMKISCGMFKVGPYWKVIVFVLLVGCTVPNFDEFLYYWKLDVA